MPGTPSIRISQHQRFSSPPRRSALPGVAEPMAIPWTREAVPPPLPPPRHLPEFSSGTDVGWRWGNDPNGIDFGRPASVKAGSSLAGPGTMKDPQRASDHEQDSHRRGGDLRRGSSISTVTIRNHDMSEGNLTPSDENGPNSRPISNHRYVMISHRC